MTDKEIEKALDLCSEKECGMDCPYRDKNFAGIFHCEQKNRDALDYINRLKAEIKKLKRSDQSKEDYSIKQHAEIHRLRDEVKQIGKETAKNVWKRLLDELFLVLNTNMLLTPNVVIDTFNDVAKLLSIEVSDD